jgi:hypothetical protein
MVIESGDVTNLRRNITSTWQLDSEGYTVTFFEKFMEGL